LFVGSSWWGEVHGFNQELFGWVGADLACCVRDRGRIEENGSRFHKMVTAASPRSKHLIIVVGVVESISQAQDRWHCDASGRLTFRIPH
jgi:hypothetical protein